MASTTGKAPSKAARAGTTRRLPSWIDAYLEHTADTPAPEAFRLWTAVGTVGAAMERRVRVCVANQDTFPNLFVLLVGRPGVGKSNAINPARNMLKKTKLFHVAPNDLNRATLLKWMASDEARDRAMQGDKILDEYHSIAMQVSEFGVFVKAHDLDLLSALCDIFDCPPDYENKRIYQGKDTIYIPNPQISILAGTQPGYMANIFPPEAWSQGFMSRMIMVHSSEPARPSLFGSKKMDEQREAALVHDLSLMKAMSGEYDFTLEAKDALEAWYNEGKCDAKGAYPVPTFPRLENYNTRRIIHILKLCQIAACARSNQLIIELEDFETALDWLLGAEKTMPNVFLEMAGRSDSEVLKEMWHYAWTHFVSKKEGMQKKRLLAYLAVRVPSFTADKILEISVGAGYFSYNKETQVYTPKPKNEWGVV